MAITSRSPCVAVFLVVICLLGAACAPPAGAPTAASPAGASRPEAPPAPAASVAPPSPLHTFQLGVVALAAYFDLIVSRARTTPPIAEGVWDFYTVQNKTIVGADDLRREPTDAVISILHEWEGLGALPPKGEWRDASFVQRARALAAR